MIVQCTQPSKTGARFRYGATESGAEYWVNLPKRGKSRAWKSVRKPVEHGMVKETWEPVPLERVFEDLICYFDELESPQGLTLAVARQGQKGVAVRATMIALRFVHDLAHFQKPEDIAAAIKKATSYMEIARKLVP